MLYATPSVAGNMSHFSLEAVTEILSLSQPVGAWNIEVVATVLPSC
jgi:hypothetical protein